MIPEKLIQEVKFKAVRSSGAGGQHVNKVSSKVELNFNLFDSTELTIEEKETLTKNLKAKLTKDGFLILKCDESRSQHKNKELVTARFLTIIINGLKVQKKRRATKPSRASIKKRLENKKQHSLKKTTRKKPKL